MIQIALVGETPIVVEEGIKKNVPEKLIILHTKNETRYKYETIAKRLKNKIEKQNKIPTKLIKVDAYDTNDVIQKILKIISYEKKMSKKHLERNDFAINITGGTKAMVAAAATAAYLAGARLYYVFHPEVASGKDLVAELPVPSIPLDDSRGNTTKTTSIILQQIAKYDKVNNVRLLDDLKKKIKKLTPQKLQYHLNKLETNNLITRERGWVTITVSRTTGKEKIKTDNKKTTIQLTSTGQYYAEFPDLIGNLS